MLLCLMSPWSSKNVLDVCSFYDSRQPLFSDTNIASSNSSISLVSFGFFYGLARLRANEPRPAAVESWWADVPRYHCFMWIITTIIYKPRYIHTYIYKFTYTCRRETRHRNTHAILGRLRGLVRPGPVFVLEIWVYNWGNSKCGLRLHDEVKRTVPWLGNRWTDCPFFCSWACGREGKATTGLLYEVGSAMVKTSCVPED